MFYFLLHILYYKKNLLLKPYFAYIDRNEGKVKDINEFLLPKRFGNSKKAVLFHLKQKKIIKGKWKKINGNPQKGKIDYVNWIELIKFDETRNYIQRVLENVNVYRYILSNKPVKIYNFFEDKPHY